jgi:hypothetical protein
VGVLVPQIFILFFFTSITIANELQVPLAKNRELQAIVAKAFKTTTKEEASIFSLAY